MFDFFLLFIILPILIIAIIAGWIFIVFGLIIFIPLWFTIQLISTILNKKKIKNN